MAKGGREGGEGRKRGREGVKGGREESREEGDDRGGKWKEGEKQYLFFLLRVNRVLSRDDNGHTPNRLSQDSHYLQPCHPYYFYTVHLNEGREGEREEGREGGREERREGGREGGKEGGRDSESQTTSLWPKTVLSSTKRGFTARMILLSSLAPNIHIASVRRPSSLFLNAIIDTQNTRNATDL